VEAVKCIGSRTRGDGAEEVFDLDSNAKSQNGVMLISWCKNPSLISTCRFAIHEQTCDELADPNGLVHCTLNTGG